MDGIDHFLTLVKLKSSRFSWQKSRTVNKVVNTDGHFPRFESAAFWKWTFIQAAFYGPLSRSVTRATLKFNQLICLHLFYIYCSVHHNILLEITNRCNCTQWILFLCLVHSTCFGRHTRPSSGVQSSTVSTATGTIIGWCRLSRLLFPRDARHWL